MNRWQQENKDKGNFKNNSKSNTFFFKKVKIPQIQVHTN